MGVETALSTVLLIGAGLLALSFFRVMDVEKGFETHSILTLDASLPGARYPDGAARNAFHYRLLENLRAVPGVVSAGLVTKLPLEGTQQVDDVTTPGAAARQTEAPTANYRSVSPGYFETMGIALREGRTIEEADRGRNVAVMSVQTAAKIWPGESALGKKIKRGEAKSRPWLEVVGVVDDIRTVGLEKDPVLMVYEPIWTRSPRDVSYVIRTAAPPRSLASRVREAVWSADSELALGELRTMDEILMGSVSQRSFQTLLLGAFALSALLLAAIGIYGVVSYSVARRTNEIGVRMALGAKPDALIRMVVRQGMAPVLAGLAGGLLASLALGRMIESL
ncbi:MAG: hypothetical protein GY953_41850, partial [bacterium]|nr:hypothetical protein [bacterium]